MVDVKITTDYITLGQLIKYVGIIQNGSEAKIYLANHDIYVNDELDSRRGKKLYPDYLIKIENKTYRIIK